VLHHFHFLTDTHFPADHGRLARYCTALREGQLPRPSLIIHGGDLVNGAPGDESSLRDQLRQAKDLLDRTGVPWQGICHTHDRFGDPPEATGRSFAEIIGHPFMAHLPAAPGLDFYLLSGSVTFPIAYHPADHHPDALPPHGYDIYQPHVWDAFARFLADHPGQGSRRVLFTHQPIVPFFDLIESAHPDSALIRPYHFLGTEGQTLCLDRLSSLGFQHVYSGHCHLATHNTIRGIEFITAPSFKNHRTGFASLTWDGTTLTHSIHPW
jgi:predicted phosphodiesterase